MSFSERSELNRIQNMFEQAVRNSEHNNLTNTKFMANNVENANNIDYNISNQQREDFSDALEKQEWYYFYDKIDKHGREQKEVGSKNVTIVNDKIVKSIYNGEEPVVTDVYQATNDDIILNKYGIKTEDIIQDIYEIVEEENIDERKVQKVIQDYFEKGLLGRYDSNNNLFVSKDGYARTNIKSDNRDSGEQRRGRDNLPKTNKTNKGLTTSEKTKLINTKTCNKQVFLMLFINN